MLASVAPNVNAALWAPALTAAYAKFGLDTPRRQASAIGQFLVEAGSGLTELTENLDYTTTARILAIFPNQVTPEQAPGLVNNPLALGNQVYANRLGNGPVASGDGYRFRGRGAIQITGRTAYTALAQAAGMSVNEVTAWCETPGGAAMAGCWWLAENGCLPLADAWDIDAITRAVNGPAMLGAVMRRQYANAALASLLAGAGVG
jgi:putative chitinase